MRFGGIVALDDVSFDAHRARCSASSAPTAPGKTTLFDVISGVRAPERGTGRPRREGDVTTSSSTARARLGLRRTFQRVQPFGWLTVEDNVLAALEWRGGGGGFVADLVVLPDPPPSGAGAAPSGSTRCSSGAASTAVRRELAGSLPIGVARMVELARAIVDAPRVLLLDEPASGLDETETVRLGEQIQAVRDGDRLRVLLVEHNAGFVMEQSDRVVVLNLGTVLADGSPARDPGQPGRPRRLPRRDPMPEGSTTESGA